MLGPRGKAAQALFALAAIAGMGGGDLGISGLKQKKSSKRPYAEKCSCGSLNWAIEDGFIQCRDCGARWNRTSNGSWIFDGFG